LNICHQSSVLFQSFSFCNFFSEDIFIQSDSFNTLEIFQDFYWAFQIFLWFLQWFPGDEKKFETSILGYWYFLPIKQIILVFPKYFLQLLILLKLFNASKNVDNIRNYKFDFKQKLFCSSFLIKILK